MNTVTKTKNKRKTNKPKKEENRKEGQRKEKREEYNTIVSQKKKNHSDQYLNLSLRFLLVKDDENESTPKCPVGNVSITYPLTLARSLSGEPCSDIARSPRRQ